MRDTHNHNHNHTPIVEECMQSKHQSSFENYEAIDPKLGGFRPIYIYLDWLHLVYSIYIYILQSFKRRFYFGSSD